MSPPAWVLVAAWVAPTSPRRGLPPALERLARGGLVARGVVYVVVGALAVQVARGHHGDQADKQGALQAVVRQPLGKLLVLALTRASPATRPGVW